MISINKSILFAAAVGAMGMLASCDDVKSDDRYILGEEIKAERAVLLEDFTGQNCLNCPNAHEVIEQLEEQFGADKVIAVSIHCGGFGVPTKRTNFSTGNVGLMTDEGNAILQAYGIQSFPMGVIDMGSPETYDLWTTSVRNALQKPTDVTITASAKFVPEAEEPAEGYAGKIECTAEVLSGETRTADIQFWVLENGIVAQQKLPDGTINKEYVHNNVFRGQVFDGLNGKSENFAAGFTTETTGSIAVRWTDKERWEVTNLSVVCFISDGSGVLQVTKVPVEM